MVEVNCETDFVARSDQFRQFAHEVALQIAARGAAVRQKQKIFPPKCSSTNARSVAPHAIEGRTTENVVARIAEGRLEKFERRSLPAAPALHS